MINDEELNTKIGVESRIGTRLQHILNAVELDNCEHKAYIQEEVRLIYSLVRKGIFGLDK